MGDDINLIIPTEPVPEPEPETSYEAIGEALLIRLDENAQLLGECHARINELERRIQEIEGRAYAPLEHTHDDRYALIEHEHPDLTAAIGKLNEPEPEPRKPDRAPEKQHPYFRKLGEF